MKNSVTWETLDLCCTSCRQCSEVPGRNCGIYARWSKVFPLITAGDEDLWNFSRLSSPAIIKIDRNVETVNCNSRHPRRWMEFTQAIPRNRGPHNTGAKENSFVFVRSKKTSRIIPVKCIVPCKHIFEGEWETPTCSPGLFQNGRKISDSRDCCSSWSLEKKKYFSRYLAMKERKSLLDSLLVGKIEKKRKEKMRHRWRVLVEDFC